jgi:hypothetical protein
MNDVILVVIGILLIIIAGGDAMEEFLQSVTGIKITKRSSGNKPAKTPGEIKSGDKEIAPGVPVLDPADCPPGIPC